MDRQTAASHAADLPSTEAQSQTGKPPGSRFRAAGPRTRPTAPLAPPVRAGCTKLLTSFHQPLGITPPWRGQNALSRLTAFMPQMRLARVRKRGTPMSPSCYIRRWMYSPITFLCLNNAAWSSPHQVALAGHGRSSAGRPPAARFSRNRSRVQSAAKGITVKRISPLKAPGLQQTSNTLPQISYSTQTFSPARSGDSNPAAQYENKLGIRWRLQQQYHGAGRRIDDRAENILDVWQRNLVPKREQ